MARSFQSLRDNDNHMNDEIIEKSLIPPDITWQHKWSLNETQNAVSESLFVKIPNEILLRIFKMLSVHDLCNVSLVCRWFKLIADQDEIWQMKYNTPAKLYSKSCKQIYMDWIYMKCVRNSKLRKRRKWHSAYGCDIMMPPSYPDRPTGSHPFAAVGGFCQHPNSSSSITITLSVDIGKTAFQLVALLEKASEFQQQWKQPAIIKQMIRRYYRFLQLKASHPKNMLLIPTLDIEIVWQTHLLRPAMYESDCIRLFRQVIDHSLLTSDIQTFLKAQAFRDTCQLYEQRYGEQYCTLPSKNPQGNNIVPNVFHDVFDLKDNSKASYSYWDKTHHQFSTELPKDYENPFSFTEGDLIMDSEWLGLCKQFMSDSLNKAPVDEYHRRHLDEIDLSDEAIERLKKSYERFLYMAAKYPVQDGHPFIPPPFSIDIMWHSHMQEPLNYVADCKRLIGYVLYHSPWPIVEDEKIKKARNERNTSWKKEFDADMMWDHLFNTNNKGDHQED